MLLNCDFATRKEDALLIFDPQGLLFEASAYAPFSQLQGIKSLMIASNFTDEKIYIAFEKFDGVKLILDPLLKTTPVTIDLKFDVAVHVEKHERELVFNSGEKMLIVHRGQRENITVVLE